MPSICSIYPTSSMMTNDERLYERWLKIANEILRLPPNQLTLSEIDAVSLALGRRYPKASEQLKLLRTKIRPIKMGR